MRALLSLPQIIPPVKRANLTRRIRPRLKELGIDIIQAIQMIGISAKQIRRAQELQASETAILYFSQEYIHAAYGCGTASHCTRRRS